jgi:hypothetical protein
VLLDSPDELEWVNAIEVQAGEPSLGYVVLLHIMDMAFVPPINIDPQLKLLRHRGKAIAITGSRAWTIVVREILEASAAPNALGKRAVVLAYPNVHPIWIDYRKIGIPGRRIRVTESIREWANNSEAWIKGEFAALSLKPGFILR